ncbi:ABC transporter ATP-binding protein [Myxococcaceae bacterium GXIMD 01537]
MPLLSLDSVSLRSPASGAPRVEDFSLALEPGEAVALVGPSGCGKTSVLRLVAGLERPEAGTLTLDGQVLAGPDVFVPPERRRVASLLQEVALFPHLSVRDNLTFGLSALPQAEQDARVRRLTKLLGLEGLEARLPSTLSTGEQQRVALAWALAPGPKVLLLDDPFGRLDAPLRASARREVRQLLKALGTSVLLVTQEPAEAMAFADRLVVMRAGRAVQQGTPEALYTQPRNAFVAWCFGGTNLLPGNAFGNGVRTALGVLPLIGQAKGPVIVSLRPEALRLVPDTEGVAVGGALRAEVLARDFQGPTAEYTVGAGGMELTVRAPAELPLRPGDRARLEVVGRAVALEDTPG